jgi:hypothetical protein
MDLQNILKQLREEHERLTQSIVAMERLVVGKPRGPGRPPKWLTQVKALDAPKRRGRPPGSGSKPAAAKEK